MCLFDIDDQVTEILLEAIAAASEEQEQAPIPYPQRRVSTPWEIILFRDVLRTMTVITRNSRCKSSQSLSVTGTKARVM